MAKLTAQQWNKLKKRRDNGESTTALAKEFGISRDAIYQKLGPPNAKLKEATNQILEASETLHKSLQNFTPAIQSQAWNQAADLMEISRHSCKGVLYSAMTFHKLAMVANESADRAMQLGAKKGLADKTLADEYQKTANEAFKPVANLMSANKEKFGYIGQDPEKNKPKTLSEFYAELG